jgi:hypothetical protein
MNNEQDYVSYTIPFSGQIPKYAWVPNNLRLAEHFNIKFSRCYLVIGDGCKLIRTIPDPYPDTPWTFQEFLDKYPPITAEKWLEKFGKQDKQ